MTSDTRRYLSSDELANAVFGSSVPSVEQRKLREEQHAAAQALPPPPQEVRREGWLPPGTVTSNTAGEFAFRNMAPPTEADLERMKRKSMMQVVSHARGLKGG
jgi:hypothetical protein